MLATRTSENKPKQSQFFGLRSPLSRSCKDRRRLAISTQRRERQRACRSWGLEAVSKLSRAARSLTVAPLSSILKTPLELAVSVLFPRQQVVHFFRLPPRHFNSEAPASASRSAAAVARGDRQKGRSVARFDGRASELHALVSSGAGMRLRMPMYSLRASSSGGIGAMPSFSALALERPACIGRRAGVRNSR